MNSFWKFIRISITGGVFFLIPLVVLYIIVEKAFQVIRRITMPLLDHLPNYHILGLGLRGVVIFLILLLFCMLAGMIAATSVGSSLVNGLETKLLNRLPGYSFIKSMGKSIAGVRDQDNLPVVLAEFDDGLHIGFLMEERGDQVTIYVPGSPSPWSGDVIVFNQSQIRRLNIPQKEVLHIMSQMGRGVQNLIAKTNPE